MRGSTSQALTRRAAGGPALRFSARSRSCKRRPPDHRRAVTHVTAAIGDLEDILKKNLLNATTARDLLRG